MKKNILIVEDNIVQLNFLKKLVSETSKDTVIYPASDASHAYQILLEKTIDVFMVDIILDTSKPGDTSGIKLVEKFRTIPKYMFTPIIFITSLEDPTKYAYTDLNCIGYVEKPYEPQQVQSLLQKALNYTTQRQKESSLTFRKDGILYPVKVKDIVYMESLNHKMNIYLSNGSHLEIPYKTCKQILDDIDTNVIVQCSRNVLINKEYVFAADLTNRYIVLNDNRGRVDIGITYKKKMAAEFGYAGG